MARESHDPAWSDRRRRRATLGKRKRADDEWPVDLPYGSVSPSIPGPPHAASARATPQKQKTNQSGKVHRLENGLIDVSRGGKYADIIKHHPESPLLRMPAEIRNKIFRYALGGRTLVIHRPDMITNREKNSLALLATCRQLYAETALVPFCANIFGFQSDRALLNFMTHRLPVQRDAVASIQYHTWVTVTTTPLGPIPLPKTWGLPDPSLPNLEHFHVIITSFPNTRKSYRVDQPATQEEKDSFIGQIQAQHPRAKVTIESREVQRLIPLPHPNDVFFQSCSATFQLLYRFEDSRTQGAWAKLDRHMMPTVQVHQHTHEYRERPSARSWTEYLYLKERR